MPAPGAIVTFLPGKIKRAEVQGNDDTLRAAALTAMYTDEAGIVSVGHTFQVAQTWSVVQPFALGIQTDSLAELTPGAGVAVDGLEIKDGALPNLFGRSYPQTGDNNAGTSYVDLPFTLADFDGYAMFLVAVAGDTQPTGSSLYRDVQLVLLSVVTGFSSGAKSFIIVTNIANPDAPSITDLTVGAQFWNGSAMTTSATPGDATQALRITVAGYDVGFEGNEQEVRVARIL